jgi:hypothetical protein
MIRMDEKKLRQLRHLILTAWNDARRTVADLPASLNKEGKSQIFDSVTSAVTLGHKGTECVDNAVQLLVNDETLGRRFSRRVFTNEIQDLILSLFEIGSKEIAKEAETKTTEAIEKLQALPVYNWNVIIPVTNLVMKVSSLEIGHVALKTYDKASFEEALERFREINDATISPPEVKATGLTLVTELLSKNYVGSTVAMVTVKASDATRAVEVAEYEIERALNVIRFYGRAVLQNDGRKTRAFVGPQGTLFRGAFQTICMREEEFFLPTRSTGYFLEYVVDSNSIALMENLHLRHLSDVYRKSDAERTDFERLLVAAIDFFGSGMNESNPRNAYLNFVISMESLLLKEREPPGLLSERVSIIVGKDYTGRNLLFEEMAELYHMRSQIVHRGFDNVTENDVCRISVIAFWVLNALLPLSDRIRDVGQLTEMCAISKFSGPVFGST